MERSNRTENPLGLIYDLNWALKNIFQASSSDAMGIFNKLYDWVTAERDQKAVCGIFRDRLKQPIAKKSQNQLSKRKYFLESVERDTRVVC